MLTTEDEGKKLHFAITYVKSQHLPSMTKKTMLRTISRRLYAILSVEDCSGVLYEISSLDPEAYMARSMTFLAKPSSTLEVKLFAKRTSHNDLLVAHAEAQLDSHSGDTEFKVCLTPSVDSELTEEPILFFKITAFGRFADNTNVESMRARLEVNPKMIKAFGYIGLLIKVGTAISELNPIAKAVMGLVGLAGSEFEGFITCNESVLQLVEEVGQASVLVADWDDPELDGDRPNQRRVYQVLLPVIYQSLHLLWTLSKDNLAKRLSDKSVEAVCARREQLSRIVKRLESNQRLDTQAAVFEMSGEVTDLHDHNHINILRCAKDAGPSASKACLPGTRVALLSRIRDWALHPTSARTLLLHGAAGKGKSAIVHTIARELQSDGLAVVPFFTFNRSVPDRSSSQLIPTWAKHLARLNPQYLRYLHTLLPQQLESSDIVDQQDALLIRGLASGIDDGRPLIFTIDALDECPKGEANTLFRALRKLLSRPDLPPFVHFVFTYRSDEDIRSTFNDLPAPALSIPIDDEDSTKEDIRKFIQLDKPDVVDMIDDVAEAAQTLFECAAVLCRELTARRPRSTSARRDFVRGLKQAPGMLLYASYHAILKMYFDEGDAELVKLFRRVMAWILLVRSPQPRRVFRAFAAALLPVEEQSDVDMILSWLGSLLSGTAAEDDLPISPLHTSLRDFLSDATKSCAFSVDLGLRSQEELSRACLRIMNTGLQFNICGLPTLFALNSEVKDLPQKVEKCISPELRYACLATAHHLRSTLPPSATTNQKIDGTAVGSRPITKPLGMGVACGLLVCLNTNLAVLWMVALFAFLCGEYGTLSALFTTPKPGAVTSRHTPLDVVKEVTSFFSITSYFGSRPTAACRHGEMDQVQYCLCSLSGPWFYLADKGLQKTVLDYIKFEKRFREGYMASAPQIYISGLVFAPQDSIVSCCYLPMFRNLIQASGALDIVWPPSETMVIQGMSCVLSVAFSPDGTRIASGSDDKTIRLWDAATGQQVGEALAGHTDSVWSVAFSPDGTRIASGSYDKTIRLWDAATGQQVGEALAGHTDSVWSVAFSPDGTRIASGSYDKTIRVWDAAIGQQVGEALAGHTGSVNSVVFSPDGTRIASGSDDETLRVWDAAKGQQIGEALAGHTSWVLSVTFSPDGTRIASGSDDQTIRVWHAATGQQVGEALAGHTGLVRSVAFSPDGTRITSGSDDEALRVWDVATGQQVGEALAGHTGSVRTVAFSPDGTRIASGSEDETIRMWDAATGQQVGKALAGHTGWVNSVAFSPDGTRIASGSHDKTIRVWDAATGQQVGKALAGHTGLVRSVAFSPDGTRITSGSDDEALRVWDVATGQQVSEALAGHTGSVRTVAFSPDGTRIASGSEDETIRVWDAATGQQVGEALAGHTGRVLSVAFSPDGTRIASGSGSYDKTIRVWNAATGQQVGKALAGLTSWVLSVAFSPDGTRIASGSDDKTIRVWNAATGQQVGKDLVGHTDSVTSLAFSPDGTRIASGS
ncbi:WD40-repeat-containing domain protein [Mycena olivaceomarginata]|nr:WD40-repeat-containing domain protein [Mycena olivaceomarginata]